MFGLCVRNSLATLSICKSTGGSQVCARAYMITFAHMCVHSWSQARLRAEPPTKAPFKCCLGFMPRCHATSCRLYWYVVCMGSAEGQHSKGACRCMEAPSGPWVSMFPRALGMPAPSHSPFFFLHENCRGFCELTVMVSVWRFSAADMDTRRRGGAQM